jgi:hypothetical protein
LCAHIPPALVPIAADRPTSFRRWELVRRRVVSTTSQLLQMKAIIRLTLSAEQPEFPPAANYQEFAYLICGRRFDPGRVDQRIALGAVEEWTVVNENDNDHIFHIHTNPFQMVAINGERLAKPDWRDTVVVPRNGSVTFRSRFLDFTGRYVHHCHMMNHEELGMMQVVEVCMHREASQPRGLSTGVGKTQTLSERFKSRRRIGVVAWVFWKMGRALRSPESNRQKLSCIVGRAFPPAFICEWSVQ